MKRTNFTMFKSTVENADEKNFIWWAGYYWLDLTEKQHTEILRVLSCKEFIHIRIDLKTGYTTYTLPSGISLKSID